MPTEKKIKKPTIVKHYESTQDGLSVKLIMYQLGRRYGVVKIYPDIAVTNDYQHNTVTSLRTWIGNECAIIDWVNMELADQRYASLFIQMLNANQTGKSSRCNPAGRTLKLVSSN